MGVHILARRSPSSCARHGSRRRDGGKRYTSRRLRGAGSCDRPQHGSGWARRSRHRLPACTSSRQQSRFIARCPHGARDWCLPWSLRSPLGRAVRRRGSVVLARRVVHASAATAGPASALMARTAVPPAAAVQWETVAMTVMAVLCGAGVRRGLMHGLLGAGDEGWQVIGLALRLRVLLRRPGRLMMRWLRLLIGLNVAGNVGLRFTRAVTWFPKGVHRGLPAVVTFFEGFLARA